MARPNLDDIGVFQTHMPLQHFQEHPQHGPNPAMIKRPGVHLAQLTPRKPLRFVEFDPIKRLHEDSTTASRSAS